MASYRVTYTRDESGWWQARVPAVPGCRTQGRTVGEARRRIREALGLFVDDAAPATLVDAVKLPAIASRAIQQYATWRKKAHQDEQRASRAARTAIRTLQRKLKLSARDTADLLGISHQRVHQIAHEAGEGRRRG